MSDKYLNEFTKLQKLIAWLWQVKKIGRYQFFDMHPSKRAKLIDEFNQKKPAR